MWCNRLPFGYLDSPRLFCSVTEALADELRRRVAGKGIHVFVFVDDFLVVGDDEAATQHGLDELLRLLTEFGIESAPHKERGPCEVIEFLGMLLSNVEGARCVALTESRQKKLRGLLDEWKARRPAKGGRTLVEPKELASLLGNLVFASQCVLNGRVYMQGMLSAFKGLEVDWQRGRGRAAPPRAACGGSSAWAIDPN